MPTIDELPPATAASDTDEMLASQSGITRKLTIGQVVAGLQPALAVPSGTLLGRASSGIGAPESLTIGANLTLTNGTLSADAASFSMAQLPPGNPPSASDLVPLVQGGVGVLTSVGQLTADLQPLISLPPATILGNATAAASSPQPLTVGENLAINAGKLSATGFSIPVLPAGVAPGSSDLVPIGQGGTNVATTFAQFTSALQPKLALTSGTLVGRSSAGAGGAESLSVGPGLSLASGMLSAVGFSIPALPAGAPPSSSDLVPIGQSGSNVVTTYGEFTAPLQTKLSLPSGSLLGRQSSGTGNPETLTVGANLTLSNGALSAPAPFSIPTLTLGNAPAATDLVPVGQGGKNVATSFATFMSGLSALSGIDVSSTQVTVSGSGTQRELASVLSDEFNVRNFGAKGDGVTDDTAALQAAITAAEATNANGYASARVYIPGGTYLHHGLTVSLPVEIVGDGGKTSILQLAAGAVVPNVTITPECLAGHNYYTAGTPPAIVALRHVMLQGAGPSATGWNNGTAHGLAIWQAPTNPIFARVLIEDVVIASAAADGLNSADNPNGPFAGFIVADKLYITGSARDNLSTVDCANWRITDSDLSSPGRDNLALSGSSGFTVGNCNLASAARWNVLLFQGSGSPYAGHNTFVGCAIDNSSQGGLRYDVSSAECFAKFSNCNFGGQGPTATAGQYSDIYINNIYSNGDLLLDNCTFQPPNAVNSSYYAKYNIEFSNTATASVALANCRFNWPLANAVNRPGQILGSTAQGYAFATAPAQADSSDAVPTTSWSRGLLTTAANISTMAAAPTNTGTATSLRALGLRFSDVFNVKDFGAKGDGVTDDTAAIQATINAAQAGNIASVGNQQGYPTAGVYIPAGIYLHSGLTVNFPVEITGDGSSTSVLQLNATATVPNVTIQPSYLAGHNFAAGGWPPGEVALRNLMIRGAGSGSSVTTAHGIAIWQAQTNPVSGRVFLDNLIIQWACGNAIDANQNPYGAFGGYVVARNLNIVGSNQYGMNLNSVFDWRFSDCDVSSAALDNIYLDTCGSFVFTNVNSYSASRYNTHIYSYPGSKNCGNHSFVGCNIDLNQGGVYFDEQGIDAHTKFIGCNFGGSSESGSGTYSDIYVKNLNASGDLIFDGCTWWPPYSVDPTFSSKYNIEFASGVTNSVLLSNCRFNWNLYNAVSAPAQVLGLTTAQGAMQLNQQLTISTGSQYSGLVVGNGDYFIASLNGLNGINDIGCLKLGAGGVAQIQLQASTGSFLKNGLAITGGLTTDTVTVGTSAGPTITTGAAAPSGAQPKGSLYVRSAGAVGSTLYVSQGGGVWNAAPGV